MPKHGSINLYVSPRKPEGSLGRTAQDVPTRLSHSSWTMNYEQLNFVSCKISCWRRGVSGQLVLIGQSPLNGVGHTSLATGCGLIVTATARTESWSMNGRSLFDSVPDGSSGGRAFLLLLCADSMKLFRYAVPRLPPCCRSSKKNPESSHSAKSAGGRRTAKKMTRCTDAYRDKTFVE